jgi:hypothetical protein
MQAYFLALVLWEQRMCQRNNDEFEKGNPVASGLLWMAPSLFTSKVELEHGLEALQGRGADFQVSDDVIAHWLKRAANQEISRPASARSD